MRTLKPHDDEIRCLRANSKAARLHLQHALAEYQEWYMHGNSVDADNQARDLADVMRQAINDLGGTIKCERGLSMMIDDFGHAVVPCDCSYSRILKDRIQQLEAEAQVTSKILDVLAAAWQHASPGDHFVTRCHEIENFHCVDVGAFLDRWLLASKTVNRR